MIFTVDNYSMELFEQHQQLYMLMDEVNQALKPIVTRIERREQLMSSRQELDALLKDPTRLTDKRNSGKL